MFPLMMALSLAGQPVELNAPAPEFTKNTEWVNSKPLKLADLKGKVVVVHFFAFGCINCQRNYPWYKEVQDQYKNSDVVIIGIHSPETAAEHSVESLKKRLANAGLTQPIVVDNDMAHWKSYGNRVWPCIYLIDKQGTARFRWDGELEWQGAGGGKAMHEKIKLLKGEK